MNEGKFYVKRKKKKENPPKKTERGGGKKRKQNFSLCLSCCCSKKTDKRRGDKKKSTQKLLHKKKKRTRAQKNHIMSADALKQKGNEAFKRNEFKLACEIFTEAIELDSTNHVLYSNRSAARVILILCVFFVHTVVYIFEAFFDRLHLFEKMRLLFLVRKE